MKKWILVLALAISLALTGTVMASGDSLISLSYLTGGFKDSLSSLIGDTVASEAEPIYKSASDRVGQSYLSMEVNGVTWRFSNTFIGQVAGADDAVTLAVGAGLLWTSGDARVSQGLLVDATTATEVSSGGTLTAGHRYLAAEQTVIKFTQSSQWMVEGLWNTDSIFFDDVSPDAYYADAVAWAVSRGITDGTEEGKFSPLAPCTRAQIVTFLWRAYGCPEPSSTTNPFTDIYRTDYYYSAVLWAVEMGITDGTDKGIFSPNAPCTRAQAVTFLYRAAGEPAVSGKSGFTDMAAGSYYEKAVIWAVKKGITDGTGDGTTFSPNGVCLREHIVTFLWRDLA